MTRLKVIFGFVIVLGITIAVLLSNKSRMQAKSRSEEVKFFPVTVNQVGKQSLSKELSLIGTIVGENDVAVVSETQGKITRVLANVGDEIKAGDILLQIDDELKHAAFEAADVNYEKAKKDFERYQVMKKDHSVSDAQFEGIRLAYKAAEAQFITARRQYNDTKIKSPIAGVVTSRPFDVGTMVQNNTVVANVVDVSRLKVKLNVAEQDVFTMHVGDKVRVSTDVYPGFSFEGNIATISDKADDAHTYPVEIALANSKQHPLKAGMFGSVSFVAVKPVDAISIPREALVGSMKDARVYVVKDGVAHLRSIVVDGEYESRLSVRSGLAVGETIVVNGQNNLKDNVAVTVLQ
ncbi:MAG TPA: efflux RND transporter periplasmic adaptor subunit [Bacteroidota bacterium]|nr:efflux RND transporter periplasmic adaptor subunit [Bacteroidota bacterium]